MNRYLCIDNFNGMLALTIGKVYTSTKETNDLIWVINDLGYKEGYGKNEYFINLMDLKGIQLGHRGKITIVFVAGTKKWTYSHL